MVSHSNLEAPYLKKLYTGILTLTVLERHSASLPRQTTSCAILLTVVIELVSSNMLSLRLAIVQEILITQQGAVRALVPLLVASVSLLVCNACLVRRVFVVNLL